MNILFISNDPAICNEQSPVRERMRAYAKEIGTLHILSSTNTTTINDLHMGKSITEDLGDGKRLVLHPVVGKKPWIFTAMKNQAHKLILDESIDLVSAQDPFEYGRIALKASRRTSAKLHIQLHTDAFAPGFTSGKIMRSTESRMPLINRIRQRIADRVLPTADGIRVVSERVKQSLLERYGSRIVEPVVIPIAVPSTLPPRVALPEHSFSFVLISVGRLEPEKRMRDVLLAIARTHLHYPRVGLMVVGDGSEREKLEAYAKRLGIGENVQFLGQRNDAWGLMQSAHAYIQASAYEGYSITLLEAALARLPIITTDVGIVGEVFRGYEDVLSVPPGDPAALATHIVGFVEDNEARVQLAMSAQKTAQDYLAKTHSTPADIAQNLRDILAHNRS
jgi:glycosyltransferase involved in cell wall biosynthesis